ncbi:MAG: CoA transferase, partial [Chloroflexota bacterium]
TRDMLQDPQYKSRDYFVQSEHPKAGPLTYAGAPFKMSETPWQVRRPAPMLGEHNEEVFCGRLGLSREELVRLRQAGVI